MAMPRYLIACIKTKCKLDVLNYNRSSKHTLFVYLQAHAIETF